MQVFIDICPIPNDAIFYWCLNDCKTLCKQCIQRWTLHTPSSDRSSLLHIFPSTPATHDICIWVQTVQISPILILFILIRPIKIQNLHMFKFNSVLFSGFGKFVSILGLAELYGKAASKQQVWTCIGSQHQGGEWERE